MKIKHLILSTLGLVLLLCSSSSLVSTPIVHQKQEPFQNEIPKSAADFYEQVLELAFPRSEGNAQTTSFSLLLRYLPSFHPESQIEIRYDRSSKVSIDFFEAKFPAQTIVDRYFRDKQIPDVQEAARLMAVEKVSLTVRPEIFRSWFQDFWAALANSSTRLESRAFANTVQLDGTAYVLKYEEGQNRLSFESSGSEIGHADADDPYDLPMVKWMIDIHGKVKQLSRR